MKQTRREFVRILFVATQAAVASRFLPGSLQAAIVPEAPAPAGGLNFLVFGDWGRNGETDQLEVAAQMAQAATDIGAQFVISVGDNFYENGVLSRTTRSGRFRSSRFTARRRCRFRGRSSWATMITTATVTRRSPTAEPARAGRCRRVTLSGREELTRPRRLISFISTPRR